MILRLNPRVALRRARHRNVSRGWWLAAGGAAAALGIGGVLLWRRRKRNYVGSGWNWPHRNFFPTEVAFGEAFNELGYGAAVGLPGWEILSVETMATVRQFQKDFNVVRDALSIEALTPELDEDGLLGEATINALIWALDYQAESDDGWIALVHDARKHVMGLS